MTRGIKCDNLAVHEPKCFSLPNNKEFQLLLKALHLEDRAFVTTVIQCLDFYKVDDKGRRIDMGCHSASKGDKQSAVPVTSKVPLCIIVRRLSWDRNPTCTQRRGKFENIRETFYALENLHHLAGTEARHESANRRMMNEVIDYFGLEYLKNYIGEITFFGRLPSIMETRSLSGGSVVRAGGNTLSAHSPDPSPVCSAKIWDLLRICLQPVTGPNPRREVAVPLLLQKFKSLGDRSVQRKRETQYEVQSISQTLSIELLEHVCTSLLRASEGNHSGRRGQAGASDYDMADVHSTVREIKALQAKLQVTRHEDERRALEEDVTGKILWFYWRGIWAEVDQLLAKVVNEIRNELNASLVPRPHDAHPGLLEITKFIKGARRMGVGDDIAHLRRIMRNAGAGISKHGLWLAAQADEQARLSSVLVSRNNPITSTRETASSTSSLDTEPEGSASSGSPLLTETEL